MELTELNPRDIAAGAAAIPENTPFVMLNLLRYKRQADYGGCSEFAPWTWSLWSTATTLRFALLLKAQTMNAMLRRIVALRLKTGV